MELVIDTGGLDALATRYAGAEAVITRNVGMALTESAIKVQGRAQELAPVDTGRLKQSITYRVTPSEAVVGTNVTYAATMEYGRAPGSAMPPAGSLLGWMQRHGIEPELEYVVRRAIGRKGIVGRRYMEQAFVEARDDIERYFALAMQRAARELGG
jgi:phage gpG-like protein